MKILLTLVGIVLLGAGCSTIPITSSNPVEISVPVSTTYKGEINREINLETKIENLEVKKEVTTPVSNKLPKQNVETVPVKVPETQLPVGQAIVEVPEEKVDIEEEIRKQVENIERERQEAAQRIAEEAERKRVNTILNQVEVLMANIEDLDDQMKPLREDIAKITEDFYAIEQRNATTLFLIQGMQEKLLKDTGYYQKVDQLNYLQSQRDSLMLQLQLLQASI